MAKRVKSLMLSGGCAILMNECVDMRVPSGNNSDDMKLSSTLRFIITADPAAHKSNKQYIMYD